MSYRRSPIPDFEHVSAWFLQKGLISVVNFEGNAIPVVQATLSNSCCCAMESMANKYKDMLAILQYNFNNLYAHYVNLAIKMEEKDESLALMEWRPS